jgi:CubicO group peptidase (beta-lactamase class C family)
LSPHLVLSKEADVLKKFAFIAGLAVLWLLFISSQIPAQMSHESFSERMDSFINQYLDWYNIPGLSIAVISDGKIVFSKGYGVTSVNTGQRATPDTIYSTASVTKLFVGTAVMQLAEQKRIDLNDPVVKHLPYFKLKDERYKDITILHLLSHTSGLPDIEAGELYSSWEHPDYDDQALERYVRSMHNKSLIADPGKSYSYSNMAYDVLGDLISKVSGMPFERYIKQYLLDPLKMEKSTIFLKKVDKSLLASPHLMDDKFEYRVSDMIPYSRRHPACGTLFSNVMEMSRWAIVNMNRGLFEGKRILRGSSYETMWRPAVIEDNPVGISWLIEDFGPYGLFSHGGGDPGYRTEFYIVPEKAIGVVVMANCWEDEINPIALKALHLLLGEDEKDWFSFFQGQIWRSIRKNRSETTVRLCQELIQKNGKEVFHPAILNQLGQRLEEMNKTDYAIVLYQLNTELYPEIFQIFNSLAKAYLKMGKNDLAMEACKRSLELKPDNEEGAEMLKKIKKIKS